MHRELFLDDANIAHMGGLRRTVHQPERYPANPVLRADRPWENAVSVYGTTLYDHSLGRFRMWYLVGCPSDAEFTDEGTGTRHPVPQTTRVGYGESADGITWEKPDLGQFEFRGSRENNILALGRQNPEGISVLIDKRDPDSQRRYKALFWDHAAGGAHVHPELKRVLWKETEDDGAYLAWSADGIHWTHSPETPVIKAYMDTNQNFLWDPSIERYVAFSRFGFGRKIVRKHKPGIGLAILRRDGFVSLDAGPRGGSLQTRPGPLPASRLHLNVDATNGRCVAAHHVGERCALLLLVRPHTRVAPRIVWAAGRCIRFQWVSYGCAIGCGPAALGWEGATQRAVATAWRRSPPSANIPRPLAPLAFARRRR